MKRIYLLLVLFNLISYNVYSQGSTCAGALPFCAGGSALTFPNTTNVPQTGAISCLITTPNPAWFYLQISVAGTLNFTISQVTNGGNPIDVDFIAWGPFTAPTCAPNLPPSSILPNPGGCSYSTAATETMIINNAQVGQVYMVLITNFANQAGQISLTQNNIGQAGAGATDCNILCPLAVTGGGTFCPNTPATLTATIAGATSYQWTSSVTGPIAGSTPTITTY